MIWLRVFMWFTIGLNLAGLVLTHRARRMMMQAQRDYEVAAQMANERCREKGWG